MWDKTRPHALVIRKNWKRRRHRHPYRAKMEKTQGRGGGLPPLRTMCAKHWPQKGKRGGGLGMRCWYEYTFRRLMIMDASPFLGWPVCGSSAAHQTKSCKPASWMVTKTGAVPLYGRGVAWSGHVGIDCRVAEKERITWEIGTGCQSAAFMQSLYSQRTINTQSTSTKINVFSWVLLHFVLRVWFGLKIIYIK